MLFSDLVPLRNWKYVGYQPERWPYLRHHLKMEQWGTRDKEGGSIVLVGDDHSQHISHSTRFLYKNSKKTACMWMDIRIFSFPTAREAHQADERGRATSKGHSSVLLSRRQGLEPRVWVRQVFPTVQNNESAPPSPYFYI